MKYLTLLLSAGILSVGIADVAHAGGKSKIIDMIEQNREAGEPLSPAAKLMKGMFQDLTATRPASVTPCADGLAPSTPEVDDWDDEAIVTTPCAAAAPSVPGTTTATTAAGTTTIVTGPAAPTVTVTGPAADPNVLMTKAGKGDTIVSRMKGKGNRMIIESE